jgi:hypothetical protein
MSATALKVVSADPPAPPGRQNLVAALARREETLTRYQAASASVDRLRGLIDAETTAKSALVELERRSGAGAAAWANGATETLELPDETEMVAARAEIAKSAAGAAAARAALPGINAQASAAAAAHQASITDVIGAIHSALYAEAASIRAEQLQREREIADCVARLAAIGAAFGANLMPGDNRGQAVTSYLTRINPWLDPLRDRAELHAPSPRPDLEAKYIAFAARLFRDPTATLQA